VDVEEPPPKKRGKFITNVYIVLGFILVDRKAV
jgi:hypothetical protein